MTNHVLLLSAFLACRLYLVSGVKCGINGTAIPDTRYYQPKYYGGEIGMSWVDAQDFCASMGMNLATLQNQNEFDVLLAITLDGRVFSASLTKSSY